MKLSKAADIYLLYWRLKSCKHGISYSVAINKTAACKWSLLQLPEIIELIEENRFEVSYKESITATSSITKLNWTTNLIKLQWTSKDDQYYSNTFYFTST